MTGRRAGRPARRRRDRGASSRRCVGATASVGRPDGEIAAPGTLASHYAPNARRRARSRAASWSAPDARRTARAEDITRRALLAAPAATSTSTPRVLTRVSGTPTHTGLDVLVAVRARRRRRDRRGGRDRLRRAARPRPTSVCRAMAPPTSAHRRVRQRSRRADRRARAARPRARRTTSSTSATPAAFRTGPKPADEVLKYSLEITDLLLARDVKMIVVACNSASAAALDHLPRASRRAGHRRDRARAPRGRAPARRAHRRDRHRSARSRRARTSARPTATRTSLELTCAACPGFVEFVESGDVDSDQVHVLADGCSRRCRGAGVDTLVLGCTHYPLLARTIADVMGPDVVLVSSADETAFEVARELGDGCRRRTPIRGARRVRSSS